MAFKGLTKEEMEFNPPPLMEMMQKFASLKGSPSETVKMTVGKESGKGFEVTLQFFKRQGAEKAETVSGRAGVENGKAVVRALDGTVIGKFERDDLFALNEAARRTAAITPSKIVKRTTAVQGLPVEGAINAAVREGSKRSLPSPKVAELAIENVKKNRIMRESSLGKSGELEKMNAGNVRFLTDDGKETRDPYKADSTKGMVVETQIESRASMPGKARPSQSAVPKKAEPKNLEDEVSFSMKKEGSKTVLYLGGPAAERIISESHGDRLGIKNLMLEHPALAEIARNLKIEQISALERSRIRISGYQG